MGRIESRLDGSGLTLPAPSRPAWQLSTRQGSPRSCLRRRARAVRRVDTARARAGRARPRYRRGLRSSRGERVSILASLKRGSEPRSRHRGSAPSDTSTAPGFRSERDRHERFQRPDRRTVGRCRATRAICARPGPSPSTFRSSSTRSSRSTEQMTWGPRHLDGAIVARVRASCPSGAMATLGASSPTSPVVASPSLCRSSRASPSRTASPRRVVAAAWTAPAATPR